MRWIGNTSAFVFLLLSLSPGLVVAQAFDFRVGSGKVSLEPQQNVLSVSLAGYGGPREGRFTLQWDSTGNLGGEVGDIVSTRSRLFVIRSGDVWQVDDAGGHAHRQLTRDGKVLLLAADEKKLYGLAEGGEIRVAVPGKQLKWRGTGFSATIEVPVAFAVVGRDFIVADDRGGIWRGRRTNKRLTWEKIGDRDGIVDLVSHMGRLYALTDTHELLYFEPDGNWLWLRVAIKNGKNYLYDIGRVAMVDGVLYGVDVAGTCYRASHDSEGTLTASAISVRKDKDRVVVVGLDVCGFDADFVDQVKAELSAAYQIPPTAVLINASHTHFAPVTQRWTTWGEHCQRPDSLYLYSTVKEGILQAVRSAIRSEHEANLFFGRGTADIGRNRNLPGDNLPYDNDVDVIRVDYKDQQASDILFLAGCHPVFTSQEAQFYQISANYPGAAREQLVHHSKIRNPIFLQGCGGDINPIDADYKVTGGKVADAVIDVLEAGAMERVSGGVTHFLDTVSFATQPWSRDDLLALKAEKEPLVGDIYAEQRVRWANLMLSYYDSGTMPKTLPVFIQTINIGNWKLVGLSRETTTEYSIAIKKLWPNRLVTVAGYSNDVSSYLPTSRHIKTRIYEGDDSFYWYGQPSTFPEDVHEVIIDSIRTKNR